MVAFPSRWPFNLKKVGNPLHHRYAGMPEENILFYEQKVRESNANVLSVQQCNIKGYYVLSE